ncbi:hypothetical protein Q8A67_022358 [Cirrhinus molitorella]|uniref:Uncharacterized protein n=1 Tax=Cirrhinus molitorella TaxID=172907 RepID=A0AA88TAZ8_9TELE|nr:hypothetical protein Q8A67_022358 [Cirrhinus molitorella]
MLEKQKPRGFRHYTLRTFSPTIRFHLSYGSHAEIKSGDLTGASFSLLDCIRPWEPSVHLTVLIFQCMNHRTTPLIRVLPRETVKMAPVIKRQHVTETPACENGFFYWEVHCDNFHKPEGEKY